MARQGSQKDITFGVLLKGQDTGFEQAKTLEILEKTVYKTANIQILQDTYHRLTNQRLSGELAKKWYAESLQQLSKCAIFRKCPSLSPYVILYNKERLYRVNDVDSLRGKDIFLIAKGSLILKYKNHDGALEEVTLPTKISTKPRGATVHIPYGDLITERMYQLMEEAGLSLPEQNRGQRKRHTLSAKFREKRASSAAAYSAT